MTPSENDQIASNSSNPPPLPEERRLIPSSTTNANTSSSSTHGFSSPVPPFTTPAANSTSRCTTLPLTNTTKRSLPTNITFATGQPPATLTDRFVQQHHPSSQSSQTRSHHSHQRGNKARHLRKYASETSFPSAVDIPGAINTTNSNSDETPSPPIPFCAMEPLLDGHLEEEEGARQVKTVHSNKVFQVRPVASGNQVVNYFHPSGNRNGVNAGNVASKINKLQRKKQDSDENGSGSVGSETTVASGTMTPQSRRNMKFNMRRPKSTGNMIGSQGQVAGAGANHLHYHQQSGQQQHQLHSSTNLASGGIGNNNNYDPSFTSATIHSLDDSIQQPPMQGEVEERRPSNFYLFEDDSNHEFDDELTGQFAFFNFCIMVSKNSLQDKNFAN